MTGEEVPADGELQIGSVRLPAGRRVRARNGRGGPLAWATIEPVPDAGRVWAALSQAHAQSGLVPFLLAGFDHHDTARPWNSQEFRDPDDVTGLDHMDAAAVLREQWQGRTTEYDSYDEEDEGYEEDDFAQYLAETLAPFSRRQFPGLAPAEDQQLSEDRIDTMLGGLGAARLGLVPASRPAEALPMLGWNEAFVDALGIAAVLRSWEDRFGARLLRIGFAEFSVLARRPPRALASAQRLAAEQWAFCNECAGEGLHDVPSITDSLMSTPIWTFWWD
jgi:hypothetical protein